MRGPRDNGACVNKKSYGTPLDALKVQIGFRTIMDALIQQFTSKLGVDVTISLEIQARAKDAFNDAPQNTKQSRADCDVDASMDPFHRVMREL